MKFPTKQATRLVVTIALSALLAACGGGDITNNYHQAAAAETPTSSKVAIDETITLVVTTDPISVNAGTDYQVIINITCTVDAYGYCKKPGVVKDITSTVGTLTSVSYDMGGNTIHVGQLTEGEAFVPNGALVFNRPMQILARFTIKPAATLGTAPLQLSVTTTYGTVAVVGAPLVTIANGPVEFKNVTPANDFGGGDGTSREVAAFTLVCPKLATCKVTGGFSSNWKSTTGALAADVTLSYSNGQGFGRQIQFVGNDTWAYADFSWGQEFTFTGELRVSISTTLPAGLVEVYLPRITDDLGRSLFVNRTGYAVFGG